MDVDLSRKELAKLKAQVRSNERIWEGFRRVELEVIGAKSLRQVVDTVTTHLRDRFFNVACVTLSCIDPEYEMTRLLEASDGDDGWRQAFFAIGESDLLGQFPAFDSPVLGHCSTRIQTTLFPMFKDRLQSFAAAPLVSRGMLIGSLNQASVDPRHFSLDSATDFLAHLAAVTAVCIDNAITHERLEHAGITDPLTGLFNRRYFERRLNEEMGRWKRYGHALVCMFIDIDRFKSINDSHGHQTGDKVLQQVSQALGSELRTTDVLARFGGEEFVMLLPDMALEPAIEIAERLRVRIARLHYHDLPRRDIAPTISIGIAGLEGPGDLSAEEAARWVMEHADAALYEAKGSGRNRVVVERWG